MSAVRIQAVLGGGGALGAFQVGALCALTEAGLVPQALHGCSAGALNAAFLASDPTARRARELAAWWSDTDSRRVLSLSRWATVRGMASAVATRADALLDEAPLRRLVATHVGAHDVSELAVPLTVTTTCLDCATPRHHDRGPLADLLVASCSLPGLFPPVQVDGHAHVDGGVLAGVPLAPALAAAGPSDEIYVLDCSLAPVSGTPGWCTSAGGAPTQACGLGTTSRQWVAPTESRRGPLEVMLRSFAVARHAANRLELAPLLTDPRVHVPPHVGDAWAAGLLPTLPSGPRDFSCTAALVVAGQESTRRWLDAGAPRAPIGAPAPAVVAPAVVAPAERMESII